MLKFVFCELLVIFQKHESHELLTSLKVLFGFFKCYSF